MAEQSAPMPETEGGRMPSVSRRGVVLGAGGIAAGVALAGLSGVWTPALAQAAEDDHANVAVLKFHTMAPVTGAFVGAPTNPNGGIPIRGIHGGGLPWKLDAADGQLSANGRLRVRVRGLVLAGGPPAIIGTNPIPTFRAIVSFENAAPIFTAPAPASKEGDSVIEAQIALPDPGFAPIIFVGPGTGVAWFAVTGAS